MCGGEKRRVSGGAQVLPGSPAGSAGDRSWEAHPTALTSEEVESKRDRRSPKSQPSHLIRQTGKQVREGESGMPGSQLSAGRTVHSAGLPPSSLPHSPRLP